VQEHHKKTEEYFRFALAAALLLLLEILLRYTVLRNLSWPAGSPRPGRSFFPTRPTGTMFHVRNDRTIQVYNLTINAKIDKKSLPNRYLFRKKI